MSHVAEESGAPVEGAAPEPAGPPLVPLLEPRDGIPDVVEREDDLRAAIDAYAAVEGPIAVDAERASGYRYGQRAYLVQLRRLGAGTLLVDPVPLGDLSPLGKAIADDEWVFHAASQDLPCLAEIGLVPTRVFDTELAGRLLGYPRVALGTLVETVLGFQLEKGHSAADWSTRPLPRDWLAYAALDVELLVELRDRLEAELTEAGKLEWAREEFAALLTAPARPERSDPWRRTSGIHKVRDPRGLAVVRALWRRRDEVAQERDQAPGRVLPDAALVAAATSRPASPDALRRLPGFSGRMSAKAAASWFDAIGTALGLDDADLPPRRVETDGPPPANRWSDKHPEAAARLAAARTAVAGLAERLTMPAENLLPPAALRKLAWDPPEPAGPGEVAAALRSDGARAWQVGLVADDVAAAFASTAS